MICYRFLAYMFLVLTLLFCNTQVYAACFSDTINFDPNQGYSYSYSWTHSFADLPTGCAINSAEITVRAKVWAWGTMWYPVDKDILCSDTNEFNYSSGYVCSMTPSTHPSPSNFYTITCSLNQNQLEWVLDDGSINFIISVLEGTYYLDYSTLKVCSEDSCDFNHLNLCTTQSDCVNAGGYWYNSICNASPSQGCGPVLEPPQKHTVGMCNSTCQETAPVQVSGGQADICFNYLRPVTALAGFMSPDFTTVWWLDENCYLSTDFAEALEDGTSLSCLSLALPSEVVQGGYVFWLVTEGNLSFLDWTAGIYELRFYNITR